MDDYNDKFIALKKAHNMYIYINIQKAFLIVSYMD